MNIKQITKRQFDNVMIREGKEITDYYSDCRYKVFFRKTSRGSNPQSELRLYYSQDTDIKMGTVFTYKDEPYIVINQDAIESDVYYTSIAVRSRVKFTVQYNKKWYYVPMIVSSDKFGVISGKTIDLLSGSIIVYTSLNEISNNIELGDKFYNFGNEYMVRNSLYNHEMVYLYLEMQANSKPTYKLVYDGEDSLYLDDVTYQLSPMAMINDKPDTNATITYKSSDETIATVNNKGLLNMLAEGTVEITVTWVERNITDVITLKILPEKLDYIFELVARNKKNKIKTNRSNVFIASLVDEEGNSIPFTTVWGFDWNGIAESNFTVTYPIENQCEIKVADNDDLIGKTFTLIASTNVNEQEYIKSIEITIIPTY